MSDETVTVIQEWPEPQRSIGLELRDIILKAVPEFEESIKWNAPNYALNGNICSIVCHASHVNLQLFKGADLSDPKNLLSGTGKAMRHVTFREPSDIQADTLSKLIKEAAELELN